LSPSYSVAFSSCNEMSHSTMRRSHSTTPDRFSWSSFPDNQNMRDIALFPQQTQNEHRLLSSSPASTPGSQSLDDRQIASGGAAPPQCANEDSRLLSADQGVPYQPSNPSPTDVVSDENKKSAYKILMPQTTINNFEQRPERTQSACAGYVAALHASTALSGITRPSIVSPLNCFGSTVLVLSTPSWTWNRRRIDSSTRRMALHADYHRSSVYAGSCRHG